MAYLEAVDGGWFHWLAASHVKEAKKTDAFEATLDDAEVLLNYAAESGATVTPETVAAILNARTAAQIGHADTQIRTTFYEAYARLAKQFGDVTASTIRNCASMKTRRTLQLNRFAAALITALIAIVSVGTFVADSMSSGIVEYIGIGNDDEAKLHLALTPAGRTGSPSGSTQTDPCNLLREPQSAQAGAFNPSIADVASLQHFAMIIRDLHSRALKLNWLVSRLHMTECDPLGACDAPGYVPPSPERTHAQTQIEPAIVNYDAEVRCKIATFQTIRQFSSNVRADYLAVMGAITAYALPIAYAWLGAYAFRLRSFAETIRKRTYHPSFADSARMITAVIAGAIVGLFKPAQGMALSPLAVAFLVGYGVELFFKFLDTLINAFGTAGTRQAK